MKRVRPSFTVEYRQAKRPNTGSAKLGWAHAKPAPAGLDGEANRIAISAFKIVAAKPPADGRSPPMPSGRILPSLVETGQADAGSAQSRSRESAATAGHSTQVAAGGTAARRRGELAHPAEDLDPSIGVDTILRLSCGVVHGPRPEHDPRTLAFKWRGNAKVGETDPPPCRKAREARQCP